MLSNWLFLIGLIALQTAIAVSTARTGRLLQGWTPSFNLLLSGPENAARVVLIGLCIGLGAAWGPDPDTLGWLTAHLTADLTLGVIIGLITTVALTVLGQGVVRLWGPEAYDNRLLRAILPANAREWPGVLVALLPAAAVEELLFRSLPLGGLSWLVPPAWLMWPLAVGFGLLHWPQGSWGVLGATLAAVIFSLLFLETGSIWAPLAAHYVMNVAQVGAARMLGMTPLRAESVTR